VRPIGPTATALVVRSRWPCDLTGDAHDEPATVLPRAPRCGARLFVGVGPRRYLDLFSLRLGSGSPLEREDGKIVAPWRREGASPRVEMHPMSYLEKEAAAQRFAAGLLLSSHGRMGDGS
jgi:hypothetical protein